MRPGSPIASRKRRRCKEQVHGGAAFARQLGNSIDEHAGVLACRNRARRLPRDFVHTKAPARCRRRRKSRRGAAEARLRQDRSSGTATTRSRAAMFPDTPKPSPFAERARESLELDPGVAHVGLRCDQVGSRPAPPLALVGRRRRDAAPREPRQHLAADGALDRATLERRFDQLEVVASAGVRGHDGECRCNELPSALEVAALVVDDPQHVHGVEMRGCCAITASYNVIASA